MTATSLRDHAWLLALVSLVTMGACGRLSIASVPTRSCGSRGCDRAAETSADALGCDARRVLVRDLGVDRYRATGCGKTVVLDCTHGCRVIEAPRSLDPRAEVAYRAAFELLCAPSSVSVEERGGALVAGCRGVSVRYACHEGCEPRGPVDAGRYALRSVEPEVLDCLGRRSAELRIAFDEEGEVVRVDGEGFRTVRTRGREEHRDSVETRRDCLRELFRALPAQPALARTAEVFAYGGSDARSPEQLSRLDPP